MTNLDRLCRGTYLLIDDAHDGWLNFARAGEAGGCAKGLDEEIRDKRDKRGVREPRRGKGDAGVGTYEKRTLVELTRRW